MKMLRFALLSHVLPPSPSGQAVMLYRILAEVDEKHYFLINSDQTDFLNMQLSEEKIFLKGKYYSLSSKQILVHSSIFGISYILSILVFLVNVIVRTRNILKILQDEHQISSIVACSGDLMNIPAAFLASRFARIPFYAYIFDDYVYQWVAEERWIAKLFAPFIFSHSAGIIGPNEFICDEYQRRYRVSSKLVRNPCNEREINNKIYMPWPSELDKIKIIYTGAIYHANYDCFRNLVVAMNALPQYPLELHIYTAQTSEQLRIQGIVNKKIFVHSHANYDEILVQQRMADMLFLPLAFKSPIPEIIQTSAPGKLGEYLESGRPVLAHVPENSFVAYYLETHRCGFLVNQDDPSILSQELKKIISNRYLRNKITKNAMQRARIDFSPEIARDRFLEFLKNTPNIEIEK